MGRLFDNREDAEQLVNAKGDGHYVEFRRGEAVRCRSYCLCRGFCNFHQENIANAVDAIEEKAAA